MTSDKEGPDSVLQQNLHDVWDPTELMLLNPDMVQAEIIISTPFHPAYLTADLIDKAPKLKLAVTAGVGSDHVDLNKANEKKITVAEVSGSNVVSVAEHVVMTILDLVRNFVPAHEQIISGSWNVAEVARNSFDLEGKVVGTVGCGRIGYRVLQRLQGFDCKELLWFDYADLPADAEKAIKARRVKELEDMVAQCDVVTINCPLHEKTMGLFNKDLISKMKPGSWLVNTARGAICNAQDVADALASGHLRGYGGDVWNVQPAPKDHPWRDMRNNLGGGNAMTPHISGTSLDAQKRYADGTLDIIKRYLSGEPQNPVNLIVTEGECGFLQLERWLRSLLADASKAYGERQAKASGQRGGSGSKTGP